MLISHKLDEVFAYSDRIVVMRDGKVINNHNREEFEVFNLPRVAKIPSRQASAFRFVEGHALA